MSKKNDDFFKEKKIWSTVKDNLLGYYLQPYFSKILLTGKPIIYIDCFAGKGKFEDGNPGSPIIALDIIKVCNKVKSEKRESVLTNQLIRSGTSIGANVSEAQQAQSNADFISKMSIALKEANETFYWLKLLCKTEYITESEFISMNKDLSEIIGILTAMCKSTQKKN